MIDFFSRLPGRVLDLAGGHPLAAILVVAVLAAGAYLALLKLSVALEDARETRNRKP